MKVKAIRDNAFRIMNEYSSEGIEKGMMDNADYIKRANMFINDAQQEIATIRKIKEMHNISQVGEDVEGYNYYPLPSDMYELRYLNFGDRLFYDFKIESGEIWIPKVYDGTFTVYYYKYPTEITSLTDDNFNLEIAPSLHNIIPYFVAAMLIINTDYKLGNKLLTIYNNKVKGIVADSDENFSTIIDVTGW